MRPISEHLGNLVSLRWIFAKLRAWAHERAIAKAERDTREVFAQIMPARPQVAAHQRSAALHLQLANEIGWTGPRFRSPSSWRGSNGICRADAHGKSRKAGVGSR